ncbi:amino acid racemase [Enterococcus pseudoavium]|uniref:Amino acid racemase n=1 Tax=Enterococcus pseudoavium TaxID=44007 RepID=A0ABU3FI88_9ENTE|nr:amino acid racemase [Enterococcus pseudoavium]MDT2755137.1 amino acid racemase [Enterococcus pseudoavium]MDT2770782.1 amino acid racemase [Enterococcus pseudoavium]REC31885.1 aspartate racemase [Enterococcus pseudoavium]
MENFFSILGGMGTMATESFIRILNKRTQAHNDQEYLNYVMFNHATVPDRTAYILDHEADNPLPFLLDDIEKQNLLQPDFIVLTCNTAHYFFEQLQAATKIPLLHMPREAVNEVTRHHQVGEKIAVLATEGTMTAKVYQKALQAKGFDVLLPDQALQEKVNYLIYHEVKENDFINSELYLEILSDVFEKYGCQNAILGCTELSLVHELTPAVPYPVIDAQSILADRTIELALKNRSSK